MSYPQNAQDTRKRCEQIKEALDILAAAIWHPGHSNELFRESFGPLIHYQERPLGRYAQQLRENFNWIIALAVLGPIQVITSCPLKKKATEKIGI